MKTIIVSIFTLTLIFISVSFKSQKFELGVGVAYEYSNIKLNELFYHNHFDVFNDTLQTTFDQVRMNNSIAIPVFFRYRFKKGFFAELSIETKNMQIDLEGSSTYSDGTLHEFTKNQLVDAFNNYTGTMDFQSFYDFYYNSFFLNEKEFWRQELSLTQVFSMHFIQLNGGYTFLQTNKFKPYLTFGIGLLQENHKTSYKKLNYENYWSDNDYLLYRKMPEFTNSTLTGNIGFGVDLYKMRLFGSFHFTGQASFLSKAPNSRNDPVNDNRVFASKYPYQSMSQFRLGATVNLLDNERKDKILKEKLKKVELINLGEYQENIRKFNLILGVNVPKYTQLYSHFDNNALKISFFSELMPFGYDVIENDTVMRAHNFLDFYEYKDTINQNGEEDVLITMESNSLEGISRIYKTPDFYVGGIYNLNKNFYLESSLRYYYMEIDQILRREIRPSIFLSDIYDQNNNITVEYEDWLFNDYTTDAAIIRNNYHNIGFSQNIYYKYKLRPFFEIGAHLGFNVNYWLPGKFKKDRNGYNSGKYDEYFHNYWHNNELDESIDLEYYLLTDLYRWFYDEIEDYETDLEGNTHTGTNRINTSINSGIDFYFERLRLSINAEMGIGNTTFFFDSFGSVGFGLAYYLTR